MKTALYQITVEGINIPKDCTIAFSASRSFIRWFYWIVENIPITIKENMVVTVKRNGKRICRINLSETGTTWLYDEDLKRWSLI